MFTKMPTLLFLFTIISYTGANAENQHTQSSIKDERNITKMTLIFKEQFYEIQQNTSKIEFHVDSPVGGVWGNFQDFNGSFMMANSGAHNQSAVVDIDVRSLDANLSFISAMLKSETFFDVEKFPSMRFVGSSFEWFNDTQAVLKGYLTINNVTQAVAFYVDLINATVENDYSERITLKASTTIKRSEFGIYALLPVVSDKVNLFMRIDALKRDTIISML